MALLVDLLLLLRDVELAEEVERDHGVDVDDNGQEHDGQDELFAVVGDGLQDDPESGNTDSNVKKMGSEKEVVPVAEDREEKVPQLVQEWLQDKVKNIVNYGAARP